VTKRGTAFAAIGLSALLAVTSCSASDSSGGGVEQDSGTPSSLTMLVMDSPSADGLKALAKTYQAEKHVEIKFVEVPYEQLATKVILAAQSKQATYDLAQVDAGYLPQVVAAGALAPLDDFISEDKDYNYDDFPKGLKEYAKQDGISYSVPLSTEPYLQWYRTDIYQKLGLKPATTWDEAMANAKELKGAGDVGWGGIYDSAASAYFYLTLLQSSGGRLLDPETHRPLLDSDVAKTVMKRYLELAKYGPSGVDSATVYDAVNSFSQLQVGQMVLASGWWSTVNDKSSSKSAGLVNTAQIPLSKEGPFDPVSTLFGWVAGISSVSPHQQAAWDFLSWALSAQNAAAFIDAGAPPPARISTTSNKDFQAKLPYLASAGEAADAGLPLPRIPELSQIIAVISQNISAMVTGQSNLDDGMAKAQDSVLNILVQSGRYKG
jgi:ABC-type glycerol-3-phosphate transport system substrate-binding protein